MKYLNTPGILSAICASLVLTALAPRGAEARIGERRDDLEGRLLRSGGIIYRDDDAERKLMARMPYMSILELMPSSPEIRIYYKTADGRNPSSSELNENPNQPGWQLHVLYVSGKSVLEFYKRSQPMTDFEQNLLLAVQAQGSYWKKSEKPAKGEEPLASYFGFQMVRDDQQVRANKIGREGLMFFDAKMDAHLKTKSIEDMQESAPVSTKGF